MIVFICWSGRRSRALGEALRNWLEWLVHDPPPFFSPADIGSGDDWLRAVRSGLEGADAGIACLTRQNLEAPWLYFETGALASSPRMPLLIPYLLDPVSDALAGGPLAPKQAVPADRGGTRALVKSLVDRMGAGAAPVDWDEQFEEKWPALQEAVGAIAPLPVRDVVPDLGGLFDFARSLRKSRRQDWLDYYDSARAAYGTLVRHRTLVETQCSAFEAETYRELIMQTRKWSEDLGRLFLEVRAFGLDSDGDVDFGAAKGLAKAANRKRKEIRDLAGALTRPAEVEISSSPPLSGPSR